MTRAMHKEDASIYRVVVNRPARHGKYPTLARVDVFGPYGTPGAARGKLTDETNQRHSWKLGSTGKVQVIENPQWKDLE